MATLKKAIEKATGKYIDKISWKYEISEYAVGSKVYNLVDIELEVKFMDGAFIGVVGFNFINNTKNRRKIMMYQYPEVIKYNLEALNTGTFNYFNVITALFDYFVKWGNDMDKNRMQN